jgi:hypothetical protein
MRAVSLYRLARLVAAAVPSLTSLGSAELQQSGGRLTCLRILDVDSDEVSLYTAIHTVL